MALFARRSHCCAAACTAEKAWRALACGGGAAVHNENGGQQEEGTTPRLAALPRQTRTPLITDHVPCTGKELEVGASG
jgi:hypothetical protein